MTIETKAKDGLLMTGDLVTITVAANAGAQTVWQESNAAAMRGTKTFRIRRISIYDVSAGGTLVHFGTGAAGAVTEAIPPIATVANQNVILDFDREESPEFIDDLMAYADAVDVDVQVTVEEVG